MVISVQVVFTLVTILSILLLFFFFFFNDTATTEIYTLSLHDALPISPVLRPSPRASERDATWMEPGRSEEHTSELQSQFHLVCRLLLEKKKNNCVSRTLIANDKDKSETGTTDTFTISVSGGLTEGATLGSDNIEILIFVFFFNGTATAELYTLSLHDALPI